MSWKGRFATHYDITKAAKYTEKTGKCPVCRRRDKGYGITCGAEKCRMIWITGSSKKWNESRQLSNRTDMRHLIK